jgi:hypothetical protein
MQKIVYIRKCALTSYLLALIFTFDEILTTSEENDGFNEGFQLLGFWRSLIFLETVEMSEKVVEIMVYKAMVRML